MTLSDTLERPRVWRLHMMRALFALNFISLFLDNWSAVIFPKEQLDVLSGVAISFWAGFALLNLIGIRYPLKMIPILLLQLLYKICWIFSTYLPTRRLGNLNDTYEEFFWICIAGVALNLLVLPWKYIFRLYFVDFLAIKSHKKVNKSL